MAQKKQSLSPSDYVHLHTHTQYSLLDGLTKVPDLVEHIKQQGMSAVAVTDHGTLSAAIEFYEAAKQAGIKPIIGIEAYMAARGLKDKEPSKDKANFHLILLAMNGEGYQNLMALSTIANLEGYYYKPRIDRDLLSKHNEGLICLSGCASSEIGEALRQDQYDEALKIATWYKRVFKDRYYLELQDHGHPKHTSLWREQENINNSLLKIAKELNIAAVVTCDSHYLKQSDQDAHEILLCVQTGSYLSDEKRMTLKDFELHVTDPIEVIKRWGKDYPDLIINTKKIADRCNLDIELGKILIPKFPVPKGETEKSYLEKLLYRGLAWRYGGISEAKATNLSVSQAQSALASNILDRAKYELGVINQMKLNGYFLIVSDFINWGKNKGIVFGPGRGSAAGSITAYALKITELDPLQYDLLFERFLNPDRISMPDIDIDIQDSRRAEVIQYCIEKYGVDRVANIVTFGRMAARNAVRDVARVLQVPYSEADRLAKMIPMPVQGRHIPLGTSLQDDNDLKREYQTNPTSKSVLDLAMQLEGTIRSHGVHAAGVVIAPEDIVCYTPLEMAQKGVVATQYSMGPIEDLGLLKIDFLGLSNLTIINNSLRIIKKVYQETLDINHIPLDDKATYELFQRGDTTGVFQFESAGMKRYLKELKPTVFEDIIAINALYRPGPMQWIEDFIHRKNGQGKIEYLHEKTRNALESTYGVLIYQEQVMQIAKDLCGFTGGQADTLRKGVAKKKPEVLAVLKRDFIDGALKNSDISRAKIEEFWRSLEAFAAYCFPKAHASCYATIAYQTAYLKTHFPNAFMAALMTSDLDNTDRLAIEIAECKHMNLTVLPPDINESFVEFSVVPNKNQIRFGMAAIKNVGTAVVEEILEARQAGPFSSLEDFLSKVSSKVVNRKTMESMIKAGVFDKFNTRSQLLYNLDVVLAYTSRIHKQSTSGQTDIFGSSEEYTTHTPNLDLQEPTEPLDQRQQLLWERELLGLYLSEHPLESFKDFLGEKTVALKDLKPDYDGKNVSVGGIITSVREITTRNGQKMAFVKLEDFDGETEIVLFPSSYDKTSELWLQDKVVLIKGKINARDRNGVLSSEPKIIVDEAREISIDEAKTYKSQGIKQKLPKRRAVKEKQVTPGPGAKVVIDLPKPPEKLYIRLTNTDNETVLLGLKSTIDNNRGQTEVVLVLDKPETKQAIRLPHGINPASQGLNELRQLVGPDNIIIR